MKAGLLLKNGLFAVKDAAPVIFGGLAIVGVIGTAYLAAKAGPKAADILSSELPNPTFIEKVKHTWKCYVPTAVCCLFTVSCICLSLTISAKKIKALAATCTFLAASKNQIEEKIKENWGEDALNDIRQKVNKEYVESTMAVENASPERDFSMSIEDTGYGDTLCFEALTGRWFWCSPEQVQIAETNINWAFIEDKACCLNDFYGYLNLTRTRFGREFGWVNHPDYYDEDPGIMFDNQWVDMGKGQPVYVIDILTFPMECWDEI